MIFSLLIIAPGPNGFVPRDVRDGGTPGAALKGLPYPSTGTPLLPPIWFPFGRNPLCGQVTPSYTFFAWVWPLPTLCIFIADPFVVLLVPLWFSAFFILLLSAHAVLLVMLSFWSWRGRSGAHLALAHLLLKLLLLACPSHALSCLFADG